MAHTWLITGAHGQLGRALTARCVSRGLRCEGRDLDTIDISNADEVEAWVAAALPGVVVNCAAYTAVDDCEAQPELAMRVNGTAVGHLAAACDRAGARLVQVSTDYVFAGDGERPYREDDPVAPRSAYGRSKLRGEELAARAQRHLIVRTAWLYGHGGRHFVNAIRRQIDDGVRALRVVADQHGSPTFCDDLAEAIIDLVEVGATGVVHAVNAGGTSWHGFAEEIVRRVGAEVEVLPVTTSEYPRPASRPAYSVLDAARLERLLQRKMPPWQDALRRYLVGP
jgi:dTDP-4-dehydrorhamnose reductase